MKQYTLENGAAMPSAKKIVGQCLSHSNLLSRIQAEVWTEARVKYHFILSPLLVTFLSIVFFL